MTFEIHHPAGIKFEAGSPNEALAIMADPAFDQLAAFLTAQMGSVATLQLADQMTFSSGAPNYARVSADIDAPADETDSTEPVKRRGRRSKAQIAADDAAAAAAATANAPTPPPLPALPGPTPFVATETLPTPPAPAPAPVPEAMKGTGTDGLELPGFLDRRGQPEPTPSNPTPPTTAPAPVAVTALPPPPAPPPAMPALILGPKVAERLTAARANGDAWLKWMLDNGMVKEAATFDEAVLTWMFNTGVIPDAKNATFKELIDVVTLTVDGKIKPVADRLGVAV